MASVFPAVFPILPLILCNEAAVYSNNITAAHIIISDVYAHALRISGQADSDPLRVAFHIDALISDALPLLQALEDEKERNAAPLTTEWLHDCAELLGHLVNHLRDLSDLGKGRDDATAFKPVYVTIGHTPGKRGRPSKKIDLAFLADATSTNRSIKLGDLAAILGIHRNTLRRYMQRHNVVREYSNLSNADLDILLRTFKAKKPEAGLRYVVGFLRKHGLRIQRQRVVAALKRTDSLGRTLRERKAIKRKRYSVKRPNALWHLDGHHKMIRWGLVIHGFIDGFSRTVTGLRASNNNRALTVLDLFLDGIAKYGTPSRLRGDRGGENIACATYIIMRNGPNRASFMWGSSTRNSRIERLWVEVGTHFVRRWRAFFTRLERMHHLDADDATHLWLLHTLFLDAINEDCTDFSETWNAHPMQSAGTKNMSPDDMRLLGQARFGMYRDECEGIHPKFIDEFYGADRRKAKRGPHGAGHPPDEMDEQERRTPRNTHLPDPELLAGISETQQPHIRHEGVPVAEEHCPFTSPQTEQAYYSELEAMVRDNVVPAGYSMRQDEWEDGHYPDCETLYVGLRGRKELTISLEDDIWTRRSLLWVQALHCLGKHV